MPRSPVALSPSAREWRARRWPVRGAAALAGVVVLASGCAALFPRSEAVTKSQWKSYEEARAAFDRIVPLQTTVGDLKTLGFDPESSPNAKSLTYLEVIQRFMPNQSIAKEDLDASVRECIEARAECRAAELEVNEARSRRFGNLLLDLTGFRRERRETGWQFKAFLLIHDGVVIYKLASGQPAIDRLEKQVKPLGPLQEIDWIFRWGFGLVQ